MVLFIYDRDFNLVGQLTSYIYLSWAEEYASAGALTLIARDTKENTDLLQPEYFIRINNRKTAMIIKHVIKSSADRIITVYGYTTLAILKDRIALGLNLFASDTAENRMRQILTNNLRGYPNMIIAGSSGYTERIDSQHSDKQIYDLFSEVCSATGLGMHMQFDPDNNRHIFSIIRGNDLSTGQTPVEFSDEWRTLHHIKIMDDLTLWKNVAYVLGSGRTEERVLVTVGTETGLERREIIFDARDLQPQDGETITTPAYLARLTARGIERLKDYIRRLNVSAEVDQSEFDIRYTLGDIVSCNSQRYGLRLTTRITAFKFQIENNLPKTILTLGEPTITAIGEARTWRS